MQCHHWRMFLIRCLRGEERFYSPFVNQANCSMADIFKFHTGYFSRNYWLVWIFVFQCLDACHLIYRYRMAAFFMNSFRIMANITDFIHFFCKCLWRIHFLCGVKPITDAMWANFPHILKNDLPFWQIWNPQFLPLLQHPQAD